MTPPKKESDKPFLHHDGEKGLSPDLSMGKKDEPIISSGKKVIERAKFEGMKPGEIGKAGGSIDSLMDIPMDVSVRLGQTILSIQQLLDVGPGSVIELDNIAGSAVDILVNNKIFAKGEVIVVDERFGVRITSLVSTEERIKSLGE